MIAPIHLSNLAQLLFADIAAQLEAQGRADPQWAQIVALLAQRLEQIQRFQAVLESTGDTCTSTTIRKVDGQQVMTEMIRARPEVAMLSDAMRQAQSLLGELMLSPSAAMKLGGGKKDAPGDFDDF
ncbi:P27 family phage terminase small subunit [Sphingomonas sanguinis]|uniref:P27 family phage terminase small subunit n=1 Tax=Sphingomonas sanguinis TaxID=33051 RepID=UPI00214BBB0B|nr:P27 family phage terminase small subunit [Sphingomonas sanguinis]